MADKSFKFKTGREQQDGLAGYLGARFKFYGTATVASGQTAIVVSNTSIAAGDYIIASPLTKGTNACYVVGTAISAATSFTLTVNTDPGSGGCVLAYIVIRPAA